MHPFKDTLQQLNDNYYHRECLLKNDEAPTQSLMKQKMKPALAEVCFKMMTPKMKVQAGLQPPLKGGGHNWYVAPKELLAGRAVLKPQKHEHLKNLSHKGINFIGAKLQKDHYNAAKEEVKQELAKNDQDWKSQIITDEIATFYELSKQYSILNTERLMEANHQFETIYRESLTNIEDIMAQAAVKEIERVREEIYQHMKERLKQLVKHQATRMYDEYEERLMEEKTRRKAEFIATVENIWTETANRVHDINVEKHLTIEKLRHFLECKSLAAQVYVALKEKELCEKEIEASQYKHEKKMRHLELKTMVQDKKIRSETEHELISKEVTKIWKQKVCFVLKRFQIFVEYCLRSLPEHAEFFLNTEKLMLLQLGEALDSPSAASIIEHVVEDPEPKPHPFYLLCDQGYKPQLDQSLCLKHCTSSASNFPVIVIDKRCVYSACDTWEQLIEKMTPYINGDCEDDEVVTDDSIDNFAVPVNVTRSMELHDLKLESSIMHILQQEFPNPKQLPLECGVCRIPYCFCQPDVKEDSQEINKGSSIQIPTENKVRNESDGKIGKLKKQDELRFQREPKMASYSYIDFVFTNKCHCYKTAKKHLDKYLPMYMKNMSPYEAPVLPNYEPCDIATLRALVEKSQRGKTPPPKMPETTKTKDTCTQYSDVEFEAICECFSRGDLAFYDELRAEPSVVGPRNFASEFKLVTGSISPTFLTRTISSFVTSRAHSLRKLLDDTEIEELFRRSKCDLWSTSTYDVYLAKGTEAANTKPRDGA